MKRIMFFACLATLVTAGCKDEEKLGAPTEIAPTYVLPQVGASDAANRRIVELFDEYGSYFLYDFTRKDAYYELTTPASSAPPDELNTYIATTGDPRYVDAMLALLDQAWLQYNKPEDGRAKNVPYRVFMADSLGRYDKSRPEGQQYVVQGKNPYRDLTNSIIFHGMNASLQADYENPDKTAWNDRARKITKDLFPFEFPEDFWTIGTYGTAEQQKSWRPGTGSKENGTYVKGGDLYESILPGGTGALNVTSASVPPVTIDGVEYTYIPTEVRSMINREMASMGFPPAFNANAAFLSNPMLNSPFGPSHMLTFWTPTTIQADEKIQWMNWIWATDEQIEASGFFTDEFPLMQKKFQRLVEAYRELGLEVRTAANGI